MSKNNNSPKLYFICGSTGAGKTTYALKLSEKLLAVRFSIDELMKGLFWPDAPKGTDYSWAIERVSRCETLVQSLSLQILNSNTSVVLDLGFSQKTQREKFYKWAQKAGFKYELHFLDISSEIRWERVQIRNKKLDANSIAVDQKTFDWMENYFEPPTTKELELHNGKLINK